MELSHMICKLSFIHFGEIICGLMKNSGKFVQTVDEGIIVSILGEAHTSIIKVICLNWTQHLNEVLVFKIVASIIARQ